jgi:hypothetical protein
MAHHNVHPQTDDNTVSAFDNGYLRNSPAFPDFNADRFLVVYSLYGLQVF